MHTQSHAHGETVVLEILRPRLDALTAAPVHAELSPLITPGPKRFVLDLGAVSYVSSAGLRTIIQAVKLASAAGARLALCSIHPSVREIINIAGFEGQIPVLENRAAALGAW